MVSIDKILQFLALNLVLIIFLEKEPASTWFGWLVILSIV